MNSFVPAVLRGATESAPSWVYGGELVAAQRICYENIQTEPTSLELGAWSLVAMESGTWLIARQVLAARHLALVPPGNHVITAAAGQSCAVAMFWHPRALPWIDAFLAQRIPQGFRVAPGTAELPQAVADPLTDLRLIGMLLTQIAEVLESKRTLLLRPPPTAEPNAFTELLHELERSPSRTWHLQEAADAAGYSPFHFSRTFKQVVGCGFHEYLDRLRTERALKQLCTGVPITEAAIEAGFSSTRSLRESLKDYLGLMPSDLQCSD